MKIIIERHAYAPELNKIHFVKNNGEKIGSISAPGVTTINEWRNKNAPTQPVIFASLSTHYPKPEHKWLERTHSGLVSHRSKALEFKRNLEAKLVPGVGAEVQVQTRQVFI